MRSIVEFRGPSESWGLMTLREPANPVIYDSWGVGWVLECCEQQHLPPRGGNSIG